MLLAILAAFSLFGCGRRSPAPRIAFYGGLEVYRPRAAVELVSPDTLTDLHPDSFRASSIIYSDRSSLALRLEKEKLANSERRWRLTFRLSNVSVETLRVEKVWPIVAEESTGGLLEFSTGEAPVITSPGSGTPRPVILEPDSSATLRSSRWCFYQPISRMLAIMSVEPAQQFRVAVELKRRKRRKREYDFRLSYTFPRPLILPPGAQIGLPPLHVAVYVGRAAVRKAHELGIGPAKVEQRHTSSPGTRGE